MPMFTFNFAFSNLQRILTVYLYNIHYCYFNNLIINCLVACGPTSPSGKKLFLCGVTVINERYVLTAAHCILPEFQYVVYLDSRIREGDVDCEVRVKKGRRKKLCAPKPQEIGVEDIIHSNYTYPELHNDIALLRLSRNADLTYGKSVITTCGGTLINHRYVLTSATCVIDIKPDAVRLGEYNMDTDIDCEDRSKNGRTLKVCAPKPQQFSVEKVIPHPNYKVFSNNIALLRLSGNADLTSGTVMPICLPIGLNQQMARITGLRADVAGWGVTEKGFRSSELLRTSIRVVERNKCKNLGKDAAETEICAGGDKYGKSVCLFGDAGGPLSLDEFHGGKLRTVQYGILSIGPSECGTPGAPSIFTNVGYYMKWILDTMEP